MDFIIKYEYNLSPSNNLKVRDLNQKEVQQLNLKTYDQYKKNCEKNCKCFKGPYSVL